MKVLFVAGFYPEIGGPFSSLLALLKKLHEKNVNIKVVSPIPKRYDIDRIKFSKELPFEVVYVKEELTRVIMPSFSLKFFGVVNELSKDVDLIYLAGMFDFYSIVVYLSRKPYIYSARGTFMKEAFEMSPFKKFKKKIFMDIIGKKILDNAINIHCITQEEKIHFLRYFPKMEEKVVIIPHGIKMSNYQNRILKDEKLKSKKKVLFLGRINRIKGIDILIDGFRKLRMKRDDVHLVIAGKDDGDGYENTVIDWLKKYNIEEDITFTGFLTGEMKLEIFEKCDVFILPSYSENFGMAIIEAMAYGLPVIVSDRVGIVREIKDYKAGIVIEPTAEGIYKGLRDWLNMKKDDLEEMKKRAKRMVEELYDIEKVADSMIKLFENVAKHGK